MNNQPLFSVIVPAYNVGNYIENCLHSVFEQTYSNFEIIVINDGSTDDTEAIVRKLQDSRLSLITQGNSGVSVARNRGVHEAQGTYLAFLDGDDMWGPSHLADAAMFFSKHPDVAWYASSYTTKENELSSCKETIGQNSFSICNFFALRKLHRPLSSTTVVRKEAISNIHSLFPVGIKYAEDLFAWVQIACVHPVYGCSFRKTVYYRPNPNGAISTRPHPRTEERRHGETLYTAFSKLTLPLSCYKDARRDMHLRFVERWRFVISNTALPGYGKIVADRQMYAGVICSLWVRLFLFMLNILVVIFEFPLNFYIRIRNKFSI